MDPRQPVPGEVSPERKRQMMQLIAAVCLLGLGAMLGVFFSPAAPQHAQQRISELEAELGKARSRIGKLRRRVQYSGANADATSESTLGAKIRKRHLRYGRQYAKQLREAKAQAAADLILWFVQRWNSVLAHPKPDDRLGRRAEILALLVSSMAETLHPGDYVTWQEEFFGGDWLGELHFDVDGDGLPTTRSGANPRDGFANTSVCKVAMALNQAVTNASVFITHDLPCDAPEMRVSTVLAGRTLNDALNQLVRRLKREGFAVVKTHNKRGRFILIGPGNRL